MRAGESGSIFYKAVVAPDGRIDQCTVEASTAEKADWDKFCSRVKRRFSFDAVKDQQGAPAYYVLQEGYAFVLPETWVRNPGKPDPNLVIDVAKLPGAPDGKIDLAVNVAVDAAGKLQHCNAAPSAGQATLSRLACEQLMANWAPMPERNAAGQPINYVRQMQVGVPGGAGRRLRRQAAWPGVRAPRIDTCAPPPCPYKDRHWRMVASSRMICGGMADGGKAR